MIPYAPQGHTFAGGDDACSQGFVMQTNRRCGTLQLLSISQSGSVL